MVSHRYWPLFDLRVRTPRVELRPPDEEIMFQLVELTDQGIHGPDFMPFLQPWTTEPDGERQRHSLQYYWRCWSGWSATAWDLPLSVWVDGTLVGVQNLMSQDFAVRRTFETGSWLGLAHQGQGIGKEMRAAALHLGFAGLGALRAQTGAVDGNESSQGVTRANGYQPNGELIKERAGERVLVHEFRLDRAGWELRRRADITIEGLEPCLELFGLGPDVGTDR